MKKRVLIHSLIFSPDGVSTAYLYNDIALRLQERGYEVVVLTTTPHFNIVPEQVAVQPMRWKVWGFCKVSKFHGMTVLHVPQKKFKSTLLRLLGFIYWHIVSFFIGLPWLGKVERLQSGVQRTGDLSRHPEDERGIALEVPEVDGKKGV